MFPIDDVPIDPPGNTPASEKRLRAIINDPVIKALNELHSRLLVHDSKLDEDSERLASIHARLTTLEEKVAGLTPCPDEDDEDPTEEPTPPPDPEDPPDIPPPPPPADPDVFLVATATTLDFAAVEGEAPPAAKTIRFSRSGGDPGDLSAPTVTNVTDPDDIIQGIPSVIEIDQDNWDVIVIPKVGVAGSFTGSITVESVDQDNPPIVITINLETEAPPIPVPPPTPTLEITPTTLAFSGTEGGAPTPASAEVTVFNSTPGAILQAPTVVVSDSNAILASVVVNQFGSQTWKIVATAVNPCPAAGNYNASVSVFSQGANSSPKMFTVTLSVEAGTPVPTPTLELVASPTSLSFDMVEGAALPAAKKFLLTKSGTGTLQTPVILGVSDPDDIIDTNPLVATGAQSWEITVTPKEGAVGAHNSSITVQSPNQTNPALVLPVTQAVTPAPVVAGTVEALMGPFVSVAAAKALGAVFTKYENDFVLYDEQQVLPCDPAVTNIDTFLNCNYYDRAMIYYVWWERTGDIKYKNRADAIVNRWINIIIGQNGGIVHHQAMMDGVALKWLIDATANAKTAVGKVGDNFAYHVTADPSGYIGDPTRMDNRIQAYAIKSCLLAHLIAAPSTGCCVGVPGGNNFANVLRTALNKILNTRDADGQWRGAKCGTAGRATHPFTVGLLWDSLIRYYEHFEADSRIPGAIQVSAEVMWQQDWIVAEQAFKYVAISCPGEGSPTPAFDLNNLIVNGFAWTARRLNSQTWWTRADQIFAGCVNRNSPSSSAKHFNQSYSSSYRYVAWRAGR